MEEKDKDDNEEFKKRIKELIEKVVKSKEFNISEDEQRIFEEGERIKQKVASKIHPDYRNEKIIRIFVFMLSGYYKRREASKVRSEKDRCQKEINDLYKLIYEELKKPSPYFTDVNFDHKNSADLVDKRRIFSQMLEILGKEAIKKDFYNKFKVSKLLQLNPSLKSILYTVILAFIILIFTFLLASVIIIMT